MPETNKKQVQVINAPLGTNGSRVPHAFLRMKIARPGTHFPVFMGQPELAMAEWASECDDFTVWKSYLDQMMAFCSQEGIFK